MSLEFQKLKFMGGQCVYIYTKNSSSDGDVDDDKLKKINLWLTAPK